MKRLIRPAALLAVAGLLTCSEAGVSGQTAATGRLMREKLAHSQKILEAIMTSNFLLLEQESRDLARATEAPGWTAFKTAEYQRQGAAFVRASQDLVEAAKSHDLDAAALHYVSLTLSCFQCHRYMKNARLVK